MKHYGDITKTEYSVYRYVFPNGKIYIGMTSKSLSERRACGYHHNQNMKNAIKEFGWANIKKEILEKCESIDEAFDTEKKLIKENDATNPEVGYNISNGGKNTYEGLCHTEEYKKRMSDLCIGRTFSEETLKRMRNSHAKERKPVEMKNKDGVILSVFQSMSDAAEAISGYKTNISRACNSGKQYKGMFWAFHNERG